MPDQFFLGQSCVRLQHHASRHQLAPLLIRYAEDGGLQNGRVLINHGFDFVAVNFLAARDNHVFYPVNNVEVAGGVLVAEVAGVKKSVTKHSGSFLMLFQ